MKRERGFTLIELMIVVTIVGILAAVAYPSYIESVRKSKRAEVKAALLDAAQALERHYSANNTYLDAGGALATVFQANVPASGAATYVLASQAATASTYTLRATRTGSMASDPCGNYELTHAGVRGLNDSAGGKTVAECW
ncbi:type IV pilin protein [Pseudomonas sp. Q2-TVG4-2]|uniref:type IV pilin protein n=1 Tax=Pseudomonas sp. Q2-TVG4-2 TaxID=1685699 RepID=UPI0015E6D800|nr:type IV pilin protein [Pseudomonas sp. Q2-TVG4-2]